MAIAGRSYPIRSHLAAGVVAPGGPVPVVAQRARGARAAVIPAEQWMRRTVPHAHLAAPVVAVAVTPIAPPTATIKLVATRAARRWYVDWDARFAVAKPIVAPGAAVIAARTEVLQSRQLERFARRGAPHAHVAAPNLTPSTAPPVARGTFAYQTEHLESRRPAPRPHLVKPIVAPGSPVVPPATQVRQGRNLDRFKRRGASLPRLAPPNLTPFTTPPVGSGTSIFQGRQEALWARRGCPKPHVARPIVAPPVVPPVAPGVFVSQARQRPNLGRTCPRPHLAPVNLTPAVPQAPMRPGTFVRTSLPTSRRQRTVPRPHIVLPLAAPPAAAAYRASVANVYLGFGQIRMPTVNNDFQARQLHAGGPYVNEGSVLLTPAGVGAVAGVPTPTITASATVVATAVAAITTVPAPTVIVPSPNATVVVSSIGVLVGIDVSAPATIVSVASIAIAVTFPALPRIQALRRQDWTRLRSITDSNVPDVYRRDRGPNQ